MPYPTYPTVQIPQVPTPRLADYLDLWEGERAAHRSVLAPAWARTPYHAEWDINVRVPRFRGPGKPSMSFQGILALAGIGEPLGLDPSRTLGTGGTVRVSAIWAQRAMNSVGIRTLVDGIAGTGTHTSLMTYWQRIGSPGYAPAIVQKGTATSPGRVSMTEGMESRLASHAQVADPPRTRATATATGTDPSSPDVTEPYPPWSPPSGGGGLLVLLGIVAATYFATR